MEWQDNYQVTYSNNFSFRTSIVKGFSVDSDFLPNYFKQWKVAANQEVDEASLSNISYQTIDPKSLGNVDLNKIPEKASYELVCKNRRNETYLIFNLTPIVKQNGVYKKITSFSIEYKLKGKRQRNYRNSNTSNSVLANGNWYKFAIDTSGVFKLDKGFIEGLGINLSGVDPKNIRIYGNGGNMLPNTVGDFRHDDLQENAIFVSGENDGVFNNEDYVLFYAQGPHNWKHTEIAETEENEAFISSNHKQNIYSDFAYYFITVDQGQGKRITTLPEITQNASTTISSFYDFTFYEKENYNIAALGTVWLGEPFNIEDNQTFNIPFSNIVNDVRVRVAMVSQAPNSTQARIKANDQSLFSLSFGSTTSNIYAREKVNSKNISTSGNSVSVAIEYRNGGNPSARGYLDYIEISGLKNLQSIGKQFSFRSFEAKNTNGVVNFQIQNGNNITAVWEVSDNINPRLVPINKSGSTTSFKANGNSLKEYVALENDDYYLPTPIDNPQVANQNLHSLENIDYLIITSKELVGQAERLANHHNTNSNLSTIVVPLHQIYNEFSSGSPDITGIRDFVKFLYENNNGTNKLKYLCLFGDASYDYKDRIPNNNNIVPSFESTESFSSNTYISDDYYAMLDDDEGTVDSEGRLSKNDQIDVASGRFLVTTVEDAKNSVDKTLKYYSVEAFGKWRNDITLVADDIDDPNWEDRLQGSQELIAKKISLQKPQFNIKKIYADSYKQEISSGGERYPDVNKAITDAVEKGNLFINYFGHGGEDGWAHERILEITDSNNLENPTTFPLFITITCEFTKFDDPERNTAGEFTFWNKNGGATTMITTTRSISEPAGRILNERIVDKLTQIEENDYTISEALIASKNSYTYSERYYTYFIGDPAMKLAVPKTDIRITKLNGKNIDEEFDTLKALSHPKFEGIVTDENGNILSDFNGELYATIYDKALAKTTLDNDQHDIFMEYEAIESKIFTGKVSVQNGKFNLEFIVPKDIKISEGTGKLSFYAHNNQEDKTGYNLDVIVGGVDENAPEDNEGPQIKLFMNDESFVSGGTTNQSPLFLALLEDENGINTSFTAVDHDIVAFIDGDQNNPIILNDFYETELDSYKEGRVRYPFKDLDPGPHTLTLKVWDTYNNSNEASLNFVVTQDVNLSLTNVLNYPNPFVNYTEFWFTHNRPNEQLETQVQIFTVTGKLVKTINQVIQTDGFLARSITWDGLDDFGDKIGKGVYVYKLKVKSLEDGSSAEKYEKLVILQ
ncbi:type IX secretion system sortase PorU [Aureivirga sp. CE67]|uniref:type IX secretion system sortase PorU n=1 Tax=Aureivirga sp. CE67 TaxID=1788983 RepID=UPI001E2F6C22|nr:type IX secretion system sortase PorU [Aureivirga sp. CE67]